MAPAAACSKAMVLLLLLLMFHCLLLLQFFWVFLRLVIDFVMENLRVLSNFAIISLKKRGLVALL